jgi:hypothetical protein
LDTFRLKTLFCIINSLKKVTPVQAVEDLRVARG